MGTTVTGWLVALLGFKLQLSLVMPLVVLVGVLVHLFSRGRGRGAAFGLALAGFGLAFVGIDVLREGAIAFQGVLTPEHFPEHGFLGNLKLVAIGIAITLVTQSSSAGVATALAAVAAGALHFEQAAAIVSGWTSGQRSPRPSQPWALLSRAGERAGHTSSTTCSPAWAPCSSCPSLVCCSRG